MSTFALGSRDYFTGSGSGTLWRFCSSTEPSSQCSFDADGINALQVKASGAYPFHVRLQFDKKRTDAAGEAHCLRLGEGKPTLTVTYTYRRVDRAAYREPIAERGSDDRHLLIL